MMPTAPQDGRDDWIVRLAQERPFAECAGFLDAIEVEPVAGARVTVNPSPDKTSDHRIEPV